MSTNTAIVGTPSLCLDGWTRTEVCFHGFADLTTTRDEAVESPLFSCFGHQWELDLYPGGNEDSDGHDISSDGYIAINLCNMSNEAIKIQYGFSVRDAAGKEVWHEKPRIHQFAGEGSWGIVNFCKRSFLMDALVNGSLVFEVRMKLIEESKLSSLFTPVNPIIKNILKSFNDEESADVIFEVGDMNEFDNKNGGEGSCKKARRSTHFYAHHLVLRDGAPTLAELCKPSAGEGSVASMEINDVKPDIFRHMLYYTYGGELSTKYLKANAKDFIDACDKYGVVHLKLEAEACYVATTKITMENMMDNLLYADSKNCALLKEAVIDFVVQNGNGILGRVSFNNVPGSVVTDILTAITREKNNSAEGEINPRNQLSIMRVSELRAKLGEMGMDVDGSREAMIALLTENAELEAVLDEISEDTEVQLLE